MNQQSSAPPAKPFNPIRSIRDLEIRNKVLFLRLDLNVPLAEPDAEGLRAVSDDTRIQEAIPTVKHAIERGAKVVIASHLGRPDGKKHPAYSLEPVAGRLAQLLGQEVTLADDCIGEGIQMMAKSLKAGQVLLLENLRFYPGEEANDPAFVRELAALCDVYVTDAFGTAHRKHASTYGLPAISPVRGMGFLVEKELKFLEQLLEKPAKPFYAILGGSKVSDKIKTIETLLKRVNGLVVGGAMAHAFWAVQGDTIPEGAKQPKQEDVDAARKIIKAARDKEIPLLVPADTNQGFDIGPKSVQRFCELLGNAKTIFWNGPLGWFEKSEYATGTFELAKFVEGLQALKVVGGGDTVSAIKQSGHAAGYDHLSTGGGAVLEFLEHESLPGIEILKNISKVAGSQPFITG
jgi:phosphoglycerate kinase